MRLRNLFIDKVINIFSVFLTRFKTRAWSYDEFLVFYFYYIKKQISLRTVYDYPWYEHIKKLFVFEKLQDVTLLKFIAEGQKRNHLVINKDRSVPDFNEIILEFESPDDYSQFANNNLYPAGSELEINYFLPTITDLCEPYIKVGRKKKRYNFYKNIALIFAFIVSVLTVWNHFFR